MKGLKEILTSMDLFNQVKTETVEKIIQEGNIRNFDRGEMVFMDHERIDDVLISINGNFSLYKLSSNGEKKVIFHFDQGYILNENIAMNLQSAIYCETFLKGEILYIDKKIFLQLMEEDPQLWKNVMAMWERRIRRLYRQLKNTTASIRMDKRLAAKLWKYSRDFGKETTEGTCIDLNLSITYLGELVGAKRETISRQMRVLIDRGLIYQKEKKIIIPDREKLQEYFKEL